MTCTNWLLTVLAAVIFAVVVWPGYACGGASNLVVGISAILIVIIAWTWVECKPCKMQEAKKTKTKKKTTKKKRK